MLRVTLPFAFLGYRQCMTRVKTHAAIRTLPSQKLDSLNFALALIDLACKSKLGMLDGQVVSCTDFFTTKDFLVKLLCDLDSHIIHDFLFLIDAQDMWNASIHKSLTKRFRVTGGQNNKLNFGSAFVKQ